LYGENQNQIMQKLSKKAEQLSMILVLLLLYLPDINIFEFIWESIKEIHFKRIYRISYEAQRIGHE